MKFVFCGGGTAGHVMPAVAVADAVRVALPNADVLFFGRTGGEESAPVTERGYRLVTLPLSGLSGLSPKSAHALFLAVKGTAKAKKILAAEKPDAVFGTGGYVSYPVMRAAISLGIPTYLHESNATPGFAAKMLAPKCKRVFSGVGGGFGEYVGTPVAKEFFTVNRRAARKRLGIPENAFFLLSFGGSGGSGALNRAVLRMMHDYSSNAKNFFHVHGAGRRYYDAILQSDPRFTLPTGTCRVLPYLSPMADYLSAADLVICRSGASTLAEIAAAGTPAILVPSPTVRADHQRKNAEIYRAAGAARVVEESDSLANSLIEAVGDLYRDPKKRKALGTAAKTAFSRDTAAVIRDAVLSDLKR